MRVHLVGISAGRLWHTSRMKAGWSPWDDVFASAGTPAGIPSRVAAGVVAGRLHVCLATQRNLLHTTRFESGSWQRWGDAGAAAFPEVTGIDNVDCVGIGTGLHVCVTGSPRVGETTRLPAVWHAIRTSSADPASDSWSGAHQITNGYRTVLDLACGSAGGNLHALARVTDVDGSARLMHTIRFPDGRLQPERDQDVIGLFPAAAQTLRSTHNVAAAGVGPALHVLASDGAEVLHTIRIDDTSWQSTFGSVRRATAPPLAPPLSFPAAANADENLHVFGVSNAPPGMIFHTIRITTPPAWRNPETAPTGMLRPVLPAVPPGAAGAPPVAFMDISAAGAED